MKGTKLYSIFTGACPVCQETSMYKTKNPYKVNELFEMHERCCHCNTKFKIEPSFFFGAMYVSYAVGIAFATAVFTICYGIIGLGPVASFVAIAIALVILLPIIVRLSRNIWINFFFNYDKKKV
ncbi:DUF983 domain-containing protein [Patiriisocius sp. Uisw_017]|mgnify:CR=1 FL=1|jgi:hypothetical protein|uniref:DUF983 domain-containing protein n=1 Tax=Patiriisocius sp. Uisw_017 TaxID=3230968 RepID=UPI0039E7ED08